MRRCFLMPLLLLAGCAGTPAAPATTPAPGTPKPAPDAPSPAAGLTTLDTTTWKISVEPLSADEKPYNDLLRFEDRHVAAAFLEKVRRFAPASYSLQTPPGGLLAFETSMTNPDGETFSISGKASLDAIWGTMAWRRADWSLRTYRFRGTPKAP